MRGDRIIISSIDIGQPGKVRLFQVKIPREVEYISGVEFGFKLYAGTLPAVAAQSYPAMPLDYQRNIQVGELKLQSYDKANVFYTGDLLLNRNPDNFDFTALHFPPKDYTHQLSSGPDQVKVSGGATIIQGIYRDKLNATINGIYRYHLKVYLWMKTK